MRTTEGQAAAARRLNVGPARQRSSYVLHSDMLGTHVRVLGAATAVIATVGGGCARILAGPLECLSPEDFPPFEVERSIPPPLCRVEPIYPPRAARTNRQGWVVVRFTIDPSGRVQNVRVVDSEPSTIFDSAAMKSVSQWRYRRPVRDGQPTYAPGAIVKLTFELVP